MKTRLRLPPYPPQAEANVTEIRCAAQFELRAEEEGQVGRQLRGSAARGPHVTVSLSMCVQILMNLSYKIAW